MTKLLSNLLNSCFVQKIDFLRSNQVKHKGILFVGHNIFVIINLMKVSKPRKSLTTPQHQHPPPPPPPHCIVPGYLAYDGLNFTRWLVSLDLVITVFSLIKHFDLNCLCCFYIYLGTLDEILFEGRRPDLGDGRSMNPWVVLGPACHDPATSTTSLCFCCEMFLILDLIGGSQLQLSQLPAATKLSLALPWFIQTDIFTPWWPEILG